MTIRLFFGVRLRKWPHARVVSSPHDEMAAANHLPRIMEPSQSRLLLVVIGASGLALLFAIFLARWVLARARGTAEMQRISDAIQQGAEAYLARQYKTIAVLAVVVAALLGVGYGFFRHTTANDPVQDPKTFALYITVSFLLGALSSGIAGYVGMWVSIRANIRVAAAAMTSLNDALQTALRGGAVSGIFTVAMSLLGVGGLFAMFSAMAPGGMESAEWSRRFRSSSSATVSARRSWRCSRSSAAASTPRRPTSAPISSARSRREFPKTIRATPR